MQTQVVNLTRASKWIFRRINQEMFIILTIWKIHHLNEQCLGFTDIYWQEF